VTWADLGGTSGYVYVRIGGIVVGVARFSRA